jgi:hypothetical protein
VSTFRSSLTVQDGMLHTSRPITAPEQVADLFDSLLYAVQRGDAEVTSIELVVETPDESEHPIADSVTGSSSTPLPDATADVDEDEDGAHEEADTVETDTPLTPVVVPPSPAVLR